MSLGSGLFIVLLAWLSFLRPMIPLQRLPRGFRWLHIKTDRERQGWLYGVVRGFLTATSDAQLVGAFAYAVVTRAYDPVPRDKYTPQPTLA